MIKHLKLYLLYHIRKDPATKQTSYLKSQSTITYISVLTFFLLCVPCTFNFHMQYSLSHLACFRYIVTLDTYFPTMSEGKLHRHLFALQYKHILFTNINISNCTLVIEQLISILKSNSCARGSVVSWWGKNLQGRYSAGFSTWWYCFSEPCRRTSFVLARPVPNKFVKAQSKDDSSQLVT